MRRPPPSVALLALALSAVVAPPLAAQQPQDILDGAISAFVSGRLAESVEAFDRLAQASPAVAPQLWQRGIALYYVGRYDDCRRQFELHRTVNPNDVENAAWHFLCVARASSPAQARAALLPVGPDPRVPMREIYQMFRGALAPDDVLRAAGGQRGAQFFARLYLGLYFEASGDRARAREQLALAAADQYAEVGGYMHVVARVHPLVGPPR